MTGCGGRALLRILVASLTVLELGIAAQAKWRADYAVNTPAVQQWFKGQHNEQGQWCCDSADGHPFFGDYSFNSDGSVTLDTESGQHSLPAYMVLKGPNPTGGAVWWYIDAPEHRDYCFAPGGGF